MLLIFDLDGTLVDTADSVVITLNGIRKSLNKKEMPYSFFLPWLSHGGEELIKNTLEVETDQEIFDNLNVFRKKLSKYLTPKSKIYPGARHVLEFCKSKGLKMCICTNKPRSLAEKVLSDTSLDHYFCFMSAGGDLETKKPSPENLLSILNLYKGTRSFYIGDSKIDQEITNALSIPFYFFKNGYNDGVDETKLSFCFTSYDKLLIHLRGLFE
jgi:HAD superfamily hydrolase (TIGR01549 family)